MPVRSQIKLLAGVAALLGLCTAGVGCQSSPICKECGAQSCPGCSSGGVGMVDYGNNAPTSSHGVYLRRPTTGEPATVQGAGCSSCQMASMLRPIPIGGADASAWTPVQRVSSETMGSPNDGIRQAVTTEPALSPPAVTTVDSPMAPPPIASTDPPPLGDNRLVVAPPPSLTPTLPPPRTAGPRPPKDVPGSGYPDLPEPLITHPLHVPKELDKRALSAYIIEPPDVLAIEGTTDISDPKMPIQGPHLVRPDGTIGFGSYGSVFVAGMTIDQAKEQVALLIQTRQEKLTIKQIREALKVDVAAYNSKFYYVITDGGGYGEQVIRIPITGNETVLDGVSQIQGLPAVASKKRVWIARATPGDTHHPYILPVDWKSIAQRGEACTNYQLYPGDRIYVNSNVFIRADSYLAKFLAPIERALGATLLGSSVVNSIKFGASSNGLGTGTGIR